MLTNGIAPAGLYLAMICCCAAVGVSRAVYPPLGGSGTLVLVSTGLNARQRLVYDEPWNVQVGVAGYGSAWPEPVVIPDRAAVRPEKVPNRLSATISGQRSAAQYGQKSAPTYRTSGLPSLMSGEPLTGVRYPPPTAVADPMSAVVRLPPPTLFRAL